MIVAFLLGWIGFVLGTLVIVSIIGRITDGEWWWK